ncbi:MAG: ImmA/IrrE family metallo-endopeptidase [Bacteroidales bacterium]|nr:ImmA/IrrE family metallo-endopeptidase [Bacteroidales bacterium]MBD5235160.1 ImmA/IrrE family metallo-endopeptidase [Barnesiella sp.]
MKVALLNLVEAQVAKFRQFSGLSDTEAVNLKNLLLKLKVLTIFRPLSDDFSGMSLKGGGRRFMLINCRQQRCRQHFTIAHELYHLFFDPNPMAHHSSTDGKKDDTEQCADAFAQMFLMPADGVRQMIPEEELVSGHVSLASVLRIEYYFAVSHAAALNRLYNLKLIDKADREKYMGLAVKRTAREYGYNTALYEPGNENLVIGDFGEKARKLFEEEKISEGHYMELLHKIGIDGSED